MGRLLIILLLTLLAHISTAVVVESSDNDELPWPPVKYTKLQFFSHSKLSPPDQTTVVVAKPTDNDIPFNFGEVSVFDDPLTTNPSTLSTPVGRSQGTRIMSDQNTYASHVSMTIVLSGDLYTGSTLSLLGSNIVPSMGSELPIVGGTGQFSYAQGVCNLQSILGQLETVVAYDCDIYYRSLLTRAI